MASEVVHREDSRGMRKNKVTVVTLKNIVKAPIICILRAWGCANWGISQLRGVEEMAQGSSGCNVSVIWILSAQKKVGDGHSRGRVRVNGILGRRSKRSEQEGEKTPVW